MFSALERNLIFNTIKKCQRSGTAEHLEEIFTYFVGSFIPHKMSMCGVGNLLTDKHLCRFDFACPPELINELRPISYAESVFLMSMWQQHRAPLYTNIADWDDSQLNAEQRRWRRALGRHGVRDMAMHGVVDAGGSLASFFYLGALAEPLSARQAEILCMLAPHLHRVLLKMAQPNCRAGSGGIDAFHAENRWRLDAAGSRDPEMDLSRQDQFGNRRDTRDQRINGTQSYAKVDAQDGRRQPHPGGRQGDAKQYFQRRPDTEMTLGSFRLSGRTSRTACRISAAPFAHSASCCGIPGRV